MIEKIKIGYDRGDDVIEFQTNENGYWGGWIMCTEGFIKLFGKRIFNDLKFSKYNLFVTEKNPKRKGIIRLNITHSKYYHRLRVFKNNKQRLSMPINKKYLFDAAKNMLDDIIMVNCDKNEMNIYLYIS